MKTETKDSIDFNKMHKASQNERTGSGLQAKAYRRLQAQKRQEAIQFSLEEDSQVEMQIKSEIFKYDESSQKSQLNLEYLQSDVKSSDDYDLKEMVQADQMDTDSLSLDNQNNLLVVNFINEKLKTDIGYCMQAIYQKKGLEDYFEVMLRVSTRLKSFSIQ